MTTSLSIIAAVSCSVAPPADGDAVRGDPWAAGKRPSAWQIIDRLQRWPILDPHFKPAWKTLVKHPAWEVRTAAAIAIGRGDREQLLPLLNGLLNDPAPIVQDAALWALRRSTSPAAKPMLRDVLSTRQKLPSGQLWPRVPTDNSPGWQLSQRRAFFAEIDLDAWQRPSPREFPRATVSLSQSCWESNTVIQVSVCKRSATDRPVAALPDKQTIRPVALGGWGDVARLSPLPDMVATSPWFQTEKSQRRFRMLEPGDSELVNYALQTEAHLQLSQHLTDSDDDRRFRADVAERLKRQHLAEGLWPGTYLINISGNPLLIRIQRSSAMEAEIPQLIEALPDPDAVLRLGALRARKGSIPLAHLFPNHTNDGLGFSIARALGQIGDPAAVPVLLRQPHLQDWDVIGSTTGALRMMGPAAADALQEPILHWRRHLKQQDLAPLRTAIEALGALGSTRTHRALLAMIDHLSRLPDEQLNMQPQPEGLRLRFLLQTAVFAMADRYPRQVADAVWRARAQLGPPDDINIAIELWRRLPGPDTQDTRADQALRSRLIHPLMRARPDIILSTRNPVRTPDQAVELLGRAGWARSAKAEHRVVELVQPWMERPTPTAVRSIYIDLLLRLDMNDHARVQIERGLRDWPAPDDGRSQEFQNKARARLLYQRARLTLRQPATATGFQAAANDLQQATDLIQPQKYASPRTLEYDLARELKYAKTPPPPGISIQRPWVPLDPPVRMIATDSQSTGGREFFLDRFWRLSWAQLGGNRSHIIAAVPNGGRALAPLDPERVLVVHGRPGKLVSLYRVGQKHPVWRRTLDVSDPHFLTASPLAITLLDTGGVLHGLDPATGEDRWTYRVSDQPITDPWPGEDRDLVVQHERAIIVPDHGVTPRKLICLNLADGTPRWTIDVPRELRSVQIARGVALIGDARGELIARDMTNGKKLWSRRIPDYPNNGLGARPGVAVGPRADAPDVAYVQLGPNFFALELQTGRVIWQRPRPTPMYGAQLRLSAPIDTNPTDPAAQVRLAVWVVKPPHVLLLDAPTGDTIFHAVSPTDDDRDPLIMVHNGNLYLGYPSGWEIWRRERPGADRRAVGDP